MSHQSHHTSSKEDGRTPDDGRRLPPIRDLFKSLEESRRMSPSPAQGHARHSQAQQTMNLPPLIRHGEAAYYDPTSQSRSRLSQSGYSGLDSRQGGPGSSSRDGITPAAAAAGPSKLSSGYNAWDDFDPEKRYKCDYCGKRFDRPSSLQVHIRTHTGVQPYTCEWPGCARTFNVKSNMLRHWRSHERSEPGPNGQELGSFSPSEIYQADQRGAWTSGGQGSSGSGGSFSHPSTRGSGFY